MEYEIIWWKDWLEADTLKRLDMVNKLNFTNRVMYIIKSDMPEEMKLHSIATYLNGLFEDLENAVYVKSTNEGEKE